jgi:hypothetical protein
VVRLLNAKENNLLEQSKQAEAIHAAFDSTGVKFHDRAAALAELKAGGREITFDAEGKPHAHYDGESGVPLDQVLLRFGFDRRELIDQRTLPREGAGAGRPGLQSKSDFKTIKEKVDYIARYGEDAFARLPLTGVSGSEITTQADWFALPPQERARRWGADPLAFSKLAKVAKPAPNSKALSKKQEMAENLAREVAKRGRR